MSAVAERLDENRVVITGVGAVTPLGLDLSSTWEAVRNGQSGISNISTVRGYRINDDVDLAGLIQGFDPNTYLHVTELRKTHLSHQIGYVAAVASGLDAGVLGDVPRPERNRNNNVLINTDPERTGVIMATGVGGAIQISEIEDTELVEAARGYAHKLKAAREDPEVKFSIPGLDDTRVGDELPNDFIEKIVRGVMEESGRRPDKKSPNYIFQILPERTAAIVSLMLGTQGDLYTPIAACASGVRALSEAYKTILQGDDDVIFAGATECSVNPISILSFKLIRALSTRNNEPEKASRPFDLDADGFVMSEGAAVMVVERLSHAKKRGARIYAEILGYGNSSDAHHEAFPHPEGRGATRSMLQALRKAGIELKTIDLFGAHATSTGEADGLELDCYKAIAGEDVYGIPISALKDQLGHYMGAAGAVESALNLLMMRDSFIPGLQNLENPRREGFNLVPAGGITHEVRRVMKNSFGFGGINASIIFERYEGAGARAV